MARYFFHVHDGRALPDRVGTELPDVDAAKATAVRYSGDLIRDAGASFWKSEEWSLELAAEDGQVLVVLRFAAEVPKPRLAA